jgi:hypothetical protein
VSAYPVTGTPKVVGAVHETLICWLPGPEVVVTPVGAAGTFANTTAFDGLEAFPGPEALLAVTVKVYEVPYTRPETLVDVALAPATRPLAVVQPGEQPMM